MLCACGGSAALTIDVQVGLAGLGGVNAGVVLMRLGQESVVGGFFVAILLLMLLSFFMVKRGLSEVLRSIVVVLGDLNRHWPPSFLKKDRTSTREGGGLAKAIIAREFRSRLGATLNEYKFT
jgi:hypothetical protein